MCFSALWLVQTLVLLILLCGLVAILRLVVPHVLSWLGVGGSIVMQVINILIAVIVLIWLVWFVYDVAMCIGFGAMRLH